VVAFFTIRFNIELLYFLRQSKFKPFIWSQLNVLLLKACTGGFEILPDLEISFCMYMFFLLLHLYSSGQNTLQRQIFRNGIIVIIHEDCLTVHLPHEIM